MKTFALLAAVLAAASPYVAAADRVEVRDDTATFVIECPIVSQTQEPSLADVSVSCLDVLPTTSPPANVPLANVQPSWRIGATFRYSGPYQPWTHDWDYCRLVSYRLRPSGKSLVVDCRTYWTPPAAARKKAR